MSTMLSTEVKPRGFRVTFSLWFATNALVGFVGLLTAVLLWSISVVSGGNSLLNLLACVAVYVGAALSALYVVTSPIAMIVAFRQQKWLLLSCAVTPTLMWAIVMLRLSFVPDRLAVMAFIFAVASGLTSAMIAIPQLHKDANGPRLRKVKMLGCGGAEHAPSSGSES